MNSRKTKSGKNKKLKQSIKAASSTIKTAFKKTAVLVMSTALITYPIDFSYVHAYFTDKIVYSSRNSTPGLLALNALERGAVELCFDIHRFTDLKIDVDVKLLKGLLLVELTLPEGFGYTADDIIQNSLELFYDEEIIDTTPTDIETDGNEIKVTYDWDKVERAIDSDDNSPTFELSGKGEGKGVSGLGERFVFKGQGKIADLNWEYFDQMDWSYEIKGVEEILVPTPEEGAQSYSFRFIINGKQVPDDEVEWRLSSDIPGVSFRAGELIVSSSAESGEIVLYAELKSNRYFARKFAIQLIKPEVELLPELQLPVEGQMPGKPIPGQEGEIAPGGAGKADPGEGIPSDGTGEGTPDGGSSPKVPGENSPDDGNKNGDGGIDENEGEINPPVHLPKDEDDHEDDGKGEGGRDEGPENDDGDTQDDEADDHENDGKDDAGDQGSDADGDGSNDDGEDIDQPGDSGEDDTNGDDNGSGDDNTPTDDDSSDEDTTGSGDTEEGVGASTPTNGDDTPDGDNEVTGGDGTSPEDTGDNDEDGSDNDGAGKDKKDGINEDEGIRYEGLGDENKTDIDDDCHRQDKGAQNEYTKTVDSVEQGAGFFDTS